MRESNEILNPQRSKSSGQAKVTIWNRFINPILSHFRRRRGTQLLRKYPNFEELKICDLGGSRHFWEESGLHPGNVVILNVSHGATESYSGKYDGVTITLYDGEHIPAADNEYDLLICNSVIEHVDPAKRAALCAEMRRVAREVYLQTPAFEFPIEVHFVVPLLHWLPRQMGRWLVRISPWYLLSRPGKALADEYFGTTHLLRRSEVQALFTDAIVDGEFVAMLCKSHQVFWSKSEGSARD
jgi:hypothetical protein